MGGKNSGNGSPQFAPPSSQDDYTYLQQNPDVAASGMNPYWHYSTYGANEGRTWGSQPQGMEEGGGDYGMGAFMESWQAQQAASQAANAQLQAEYQEQQRRAEGTRQLDEMFGSRLNAANKAISETNASINDELAHAATRGIDYTITPEQKQERIDNAFAAYWAEGDEANYNTFLSEFGTDRHKWTLNVKRGTAPSTANALPEEGSKVGGKVKRTNKTLMTGGEDEADTTAAAGKTLLGGK